MSFCLHLNLPLGCIPGSESLNTAISQETLPSCHTELLSPVCKSQGLSHLTSRSLYRLGPLPGTPSLDPRTHTWVLSDEWLLPPGSIPCSTQVPQEGALHVSPRPLFLVIAVVMLQLHHVLLSRLLLLSQHSAQSRLSASVRGLNTSDVIPSAYLCDPYVWRLFHLLLTIG